MKTNIGKVFFGILKKHFPAESELSRLFNKRSVKISYSCMPSMKSLISGHNKKIIRSQQNDDKVERRGCNCRGGEESCPLSGKCQTLSLVYRAEVNSVEGAKEYLGQASNTFKLRYNGHTDSFRNAKKKKETTLSHYLWKLREKEVESEVKFSIAALARPYTMETKKCQLCNMEKTLIACQDQAKALNRRGEIMTRCRHRDRYILTNWVTHHHPRLDEDEHPVPPVPDAQDDGDGLESTAVEDEDEHPAPPVPDVLHRTAVENEEVQQEDMEDEGGPMTRSRARARNRHIL